MNEYDLTLIENHAPYLRHADLFGNINSTYAWYLTAPLSNHLIQLFPFLITYRFNKIRNQ